MRKRNHAPTFTPPTSCKDVLDDNKATASLVPYGTPNLPTFQSSPPYFEVGVKMHTLFPKWNFPLDFPDISTLRKTSELALESYFKVAAEVPTLLFAIGM